MKNRLSQDYLVGQRTRQADAIACKPLSQQAPVDASAMRALARYGEEQSDFGAFMSRLFRDCPEQKG
jgi:hypothetical protein